MERAGAGAGLASLLTAVYDEYLHGQDRYISRIWYKFHPEKDQNPDNMFKFSFSEFVRFLVNGTAEFADDPYVLDHQGVSYHWAPFWQECPVCHNLSRPHTVLHMETLQTDLAGLLDKVGLGQHANLFPHTHTQPGGGSAQHRDGLVKQLQPGQLQQLAQLYSLDYRLTGYSLPESNL